MFPLADLRKTRVWQEAREEGRQERQQELVRALLARGNAIKQIADDLDIPIVEVRRIARRGRNGDRHAS